MAVSAPWDLQPRPVEAGEAHPDIEKIAIDLLNDRGFVTESVNLVQTVDADVDGDGRIETFVVAEDTEVTFNAGSGVYSIVFVLSPSFQTPRVVDESVIPPDQEAGAVSFRVSAVADLSGDGSMEVVVHRSAWESSLVTVFELVDGQFYDRIGAGCGV